MQRFAFAVALVTTMSAAASFLTLWGVAAQQRARVDVDGDDVGGVVTSAKGPEAGVWVIAETTDLATKFAKIVVTNDDGQYVLPDLPKATYRLWVRGYGLLDSTPVTATPGRTINLSAVVAPTARVAAEIYPSNYWYALLEVPAEHEFPGTGAEGNGISTAMKNQAQWISHLKTGVVGCLACHQIGNKATRTISPTLGTFASSIDAWDRRVKSGQDGPQMSSLVDTFGRQRALKQFADWTDRIAAGEYPTDGPPRPAGVERNVVLTLWDWSTPTHYVHDAISTDKRNPTVNPNGPIFGPAEVSADHVSALDPTKFKSWQIPVPVFDPAMAFAGNQKLAYPWAYFGSEVLWQGRTSPHTSAMDGRGRVWTAARVRGADTSAFCREGASHPSARHFPVARSGRQAVVYDPKTDKTTPVDICAPSHHLQFAEDANDTLWFSSGIGAGDVIGWLNTKMFDQTQDAVRSQGWTPLILDTNGNGKQDTWVEPDQPIDPTKDTRIRAAFYSIVSSPIDGAIWGSSVTFPGGVIRLSPGTNPPFTTLVEVYEAPWGNPKAPVQGFTPRGVDIDRNGVVWTNLGGSGHLASFDRRKCQVLNGATATGQHCPEGWTLYPVPGPSFKGAKVGGNADASYFNWVDQFDTFGLGRNVPMLAGNGSDSILALLPDTRTWVTLRVPYPLGFYSKGFDGRIDDPKAGWKGRGLWATHNERTHWHIEGGPGTRGKVIKFQLRPHPLAH